MKNSNVLKWRKGIISIGGDGILFEIINGVMERPDWKHIINTIPFGIIPGGSGNGLAKSLSTCTKYVLQRGSIFRRIELRVHS